MAIRGLNSILIGIFDAVFRPHRFVTVQRNTYSNSRSATLRQIVYLSVIFIVNLVGYALPLTFAGVGVPSNVDVPFIFSSAFGGFVSDPASLYRLLIGFLQNSLFITIAAVFTLFTYHGGVLLTLRSRGIIQSMHTVVYSSSAYLVAIFSGVWFLSTHSGVATARQFVRNLQAKFVYAIIDLLDSNLDLPGGRPGEITTGTFSQAGQWVIVLILISSLYFVLSLYFGALLNHDMERTTAVVAVLAVLISPIIYIAGSIIITTTLG